MTKFVKAFSKMRQKGYLFYTLMVALPLLNYAIFYIGVNLKNVIMAFQKYSFVDGGKLVEPMGLFWFKSILKDTDLIGYVLKNSLLYSGTMLLIVMPITIFFAYYIFKKYRFSTFFKIMIFTPSIICSMVLVIFYKSFVQSVVQNVIMQADKTNQILQDDNKARVVLLILYVIMGFSSNILLFLNAMSQLSPSVLEAAKVDGASEMRTFISIVFPSIWGTVVSMVVIILATIGTDQANLNAMFGNSVDRPMHTIGYHIWVSMFVNGTESITQYPYCSAFGLLVTVVLTPITMIVRFLMNKFGPSEN